ncbi:MAG: uroporphyrinogen-III C-methyltransferase [Acidovorax sp.]|nr:uroporphyrinogen-III C-methyltransferase [Acidovorax sp.]
MSTDGAPQPSFTPPPTPGPRTPSGPSPLAWVAMVLALAGLGSSVLLWQKVGGMQEQLARQTADSGTQATEARALARESQDLVREAAGRLSVVEARVQEATLQRTQLEDLIHSVSRSRDETLLVDVESALRIALQQAQFSGSLEPLTVTLKSSAQRIERAAQPRLAPVHRAMEQDLERLGRANVMDTAGLLGRLDELVRIVDDMPLLSSVAMVPPSGVASAASGVARPVALDEAVTPTQWAWWQYWGARVWNASADEARDLVRIRRIDHPDAMLLAPDQAFFLRENLKLKLLNARLGLLSRQYDAARADLGAASATVAKYFDGQSRRTQSAQSLLLQIQTHLRQTEQPSLNDTLSALATAAASR